MNYDFDFNTLLGSDEVALKPASHALTVSYANVGSFTNLNIEANNNFDKDSDNGLMNMFNGDLEWSLSGTVYFSLNFVLKWAINRFNPGTNDRQ